jgi:hypothetical protein
MDGPPGLPGVDGVSFQPAEFIGSEACAECHQELYDIFADSGHNHILTPVIDGDRPDFPFSAVDQPPEGYEWADIAYVVGGFRWKARFVDQDGYVITGEDEAAATQLNFRNEDLDTRDEWVPYHAGEEVPYDCGTCHATGYSAQGNQDDRPGVVGTWALAGVQCEECHGPGSLHANHPLAYSPQIDRDAATCTSCHIAEITNETAFTERFIDHHDSYGDLFAGKHALIDCVTCHDPHTGVVQLRRAGAPTTLTTCTSCHYDQDRYPENHAGIQVACESCHMPLLIQVAVGDPAQFMADKRTHQVSIDAGQIEQVNANGTIHPQLALDTSCRSCHHEGGNGRVKTDEELLSAAANYHTPPIAMPAPEGEEGADVAGTPTPAP